MYLFQCSVKEDTTSPWATQTICSKDFKGSLEVAQLPAKVVDILLTDLFALRVHAFICFHFSTRARFSVDFLAFRLTGEVVPRMFCPIQAAEHKRNQSIWGKLPAIPCQTHFKWAPHSSVPPLLWLRGGPFVFGDSVVAFWQSLSLVPQSVCVPKQKNSLSLSRLSISCGLKLI